MDKSNQGLVGQVCQLNEHRVAGGRVEWNSTPKESHCCVRGLSKRDFPGFSEKCSWPLGSALPLPLMPWAGEPERHRLLTPHGGPWALVPTSPATSLQILQSTPRSPLSCTLLPGLPETPRNSPDLCVSPGLGG